MPRGGGTCYRRAMGTTGETAAILAAARQYVIRKSDEGVTVGLLFEGPHYAEATSQEGDVDAAVKAAFERAKKTATPAARAPAHS